FGIRCLCPTSWHLCLCKPDLAVLARSEGWTRTRGRGLLLATLRRSFPCRWGRHPPEDFHKAFRQRLTESKSRQLRENSQGLLCCCQRRRVRRCPNGGAYGSHHQHSSRWQACRNRVHSSIPAAVKIRLYRIPS